MLFQVYFVPLLYCPYLFFMNTHESYISQTTLGSEINRHKTFTACGSESLFSHSPILPCCHVINIVGVAPGIADKSYQNQSLLMRTGPAISKENGSLNCCQDSKVYFQTTPTAADIYLLWELLQKYQGWCWSIKGRPEAIWAKVLKLLTCSLWIAWKTYFIDGGWTLNHCHEHKILLRSRAIQLKVSGIPKRISPHWSESLNRKCC